VFETGHFKVLLKLRAAVDLDGLDPEGKLPFEVLQEAGCGQASLFSISPGSIPSAEKITGAELIADIVGLKPKLERIDLDQLARGLDGIAVGHPDGIPGFPAPLQIPDPLKKWPESTGIGGPFEPEWVSGLKRNHCPLSTGIYIQLRLSAF